MNHELLEKANKCKAEIDYFESIKKRYEEIVERKSGEFRPSEQIVKSVLRGGYQTTDIGIGQNREMQQLFEDEYMRFLKMMIIHIDEHLVSLKKYYDSL